MTVVEASTGATRDSRPRVPPDLARQVLDALVHLHDPVYLQAHPLARRIAELDSVSGQEINATQAARVLRRRLEEAIAALEAGAAPSLPNTARGARLLRLRYLEAQEPWAVQRELAVSRAQFYRDRARALEALISLLVQQRALDRREREVSAREGTQPSTFWAEPDGEWLGSTAPRPTETGGSHDLAAAQPRLATWSALSLMSIAWGFAWFVVWSFAQTTNWLAAWALGGAVSGLATGAILRETTSTISWNHARIVAFGWTVAWTGVWLLGGSITPFIEWAFVTERSAIAEPNSVAYAVARVTGWAASGLLMGSVLGRAGSGRDWFLVAAVALGWVTAGSVGHALFWGLAPSVHSAGLRFAISGTAEGAIGGAVTLWQLCLVRRRASLSQHFATARGRGVPV